MKRRAGLGSVLATLALVGCGGGPGSVFSDFLGPGTTPGGSFVTEQPAVVRGVIVTRDRDGKVLIVASQSAVNEPTTPVAGVAVALVELSLQALTGPTGAYQFNDVPPGTYTLRVTVPANLGGATANFTIRLDPAQVLEGLPAGADL